MNRFATFGLAVAVAAVVAILAVGIRLAGPSDGFGSGATPTPEPTATPTPSVSEPTPTPDDSVAIGSFVILDPATQQPPFDAAPPITVTVPSSGWAGFPENGALVKGDFGVDGAALLTGDSGPSSYYVYGDPCQWESTIPDAPATTVDEIVQALAAQASRDATAPEDVTVDGYPGKSITIHVPDATVFSDCDQGNFATMGVNAAEGPTRIQQAPGQVDEMWILDVDGVIVILDATYGPNTPGALVDEVRSIAESATFGPH